MIFDTIVDNRPCTGPIAIYGAAGTGKRYLLKALYNDFLLSGVHPVILAPTGIATFSVYGISIHRFFGRNPNGSIAEKKGMFRRYILKLCLQKAESIESRAGIVIQAFQLTISSSKEAGEEGFFWVRAYLKKAVKKRKALRYAPCQTMSAANRENL